MAESGPGKIRLFDDFMGPEIPLAIAVAHTAAAGYFMGPFAIKGDTDTNDAGVLALGVTSGAVRLTTTNEDTKGVALCTDLVFQPSLNGAIIVEARVQMSALTAREIFIGICGTVADDVRSPLTYASAGVLTKTVSNYAGFFMASELAGTAAAEWHAVYNGGDTTGPTASADMETGIVAVAGEYDVLRLIVEADGTVEFWINGNLESTVETAVATTTLQGVICGPFANDNVVATLDVDYLMVDANRDWTR